MSYEANIYYPKNADKLTQEWQFLHKKDLHNSENNINFADENKKVFYAEQTDLCHWGNIIHRPHRMQPAFRIKPCANCRQSALEQS